MGLEVERLGHKGEGVANGPVYVARALPGEFVEGDVEDSRIAAPRILKPSSDRVTPGCRHYKGCGGCSLQHASDEFVAAWKQDMVRSALSARGLDAPLRRFHTSPARSRRRATFSGRRTKSGALVGFHANASDVIQEVPDCIVLRPSLVAALSELRAIVVSVTSRKGQVRLSVTETEGGLDIVIEGGKPMSPEMNNALLEIAGSSDFARLSYDDEVLAILQSPTVMVGGVRVTPPPGCFLQATREGEAALLYSVKDALNGVTGEVADLFCGVGTFALNLSGAHEVFAVESDHAMLGALDHAWRHASGLRRISTERRDLFRKPMLPDELARFSGIVVDPPRAGAEVQMREIARSGVNRVAAVSCNPITFARDAEILMREGYSLDWIDVVDQFRWSPHIELVAQFSLD